MCKADHFCCKGLNSRKWINKMQSVDILLCIQTAGSHFLCWNWHFYGLTETCQPHSIMYMFWLLFYLISLLCNANSFCKARPTQSFFVMYILSLCFYLPWCRNFTGSFMVLCLQSWLWECSSYCSLASWIGFVNTPLLISYGFCGEMRCLGGPHCDNIKTMLSLLFLHYIPLLVAKIEYMIPFSVKWMFMSLITTVISLGTIMQYCWLGSGW